MYIVVHCSDSPNDLKTTAADIHSWHKEKGFDGIGYHYVIHRDGTVERGRPLYWQGAHCRGHNRHSVGICLIGRDNYPEAQLRSLRRICKQLKKKWINSAVVGHRDLDSSKTCPNFDAKKWWRDVQ